MRDIKDLYTPEYYESLKMRAWRASIIASAVVKVFNPATVIDVGCGDASILGCLSSFGVDVCGIEFSENVIAYLCIPRERVMFGDMRQPFWISLNRVGRLVLCFNVAEHIDPDCTEVFLDNIVLFGDQILFASMDKFEGSPRVVNCRKTDFWEESFVKRGFQIDREKVQEIRNLVGDLRKKPVMKMVVDFLIYGRRCFDD